MRRFFILYLACLAGLPFSFALGQVPPASPQPVPPALQAGTASHRSFTDWKNACAKLPPNRRLRGRQLTKEQLPLPQFEEFDRVLSDFLNQCKTGSMGQTNLWVGDLPTAEAFFNTQSAYFLKPDAATALFVQKFIPGPRNLTSVPPFQPFAAKLEVSENSEIFFHADLHGDIHSLLANLTWLNEQGYLRDFTIAKPEFYMVLTGDYTDRGQYGIEVLYTLLRLKLANPDKIFLLRGNHEELSLAARYGFLSEGITKYGSAFNTQKVIRAYDFLPVVIYVGTSGNLVQSHHGGMEPGFDPRSLLNAPGAVRFQFLGTLNQRRFLDTHPEWTSGWDAGSRALTGRAFRDFTPEGPVSSILGFMWNDFTIVPGEPEFSLDPGRAFVYGKQATQYLLAQTHTDRNKVQAVFRGHQQSSALNPMMRRLIASKGIFRHWQERDSIAKREAEVAELAKLLEQDPVRPVPVGSVWTLNVSPDSVYGEGCGFSFDTFGLLKTAKDFSDWRLRVVNIEIPK